MNEVHQELNEPKLLSEINEHMKILLDPYGRTTGVRPSPVEALALRMMMIVYETDLPVDGIVKGLKAPGWPLQGWAALHRLAQALSQACRAPAAEKMRKSAA